jgi:hypothetical protein
LRFLVPGLAILALAACAPRPAPVPEPPAPVDSGVPITAEPVPLNPADPKQDRIGDFVYAGGLALTSTGTARLHGLSDLRILSGNKLVAISDEGDLLEADLLFDKGGRPARLINARFSALADLDGKPLQGKQESDSEGLAILADGERLVSFEGRHRIWRYPAAGGAAQEAPFPMAAADFPPNGGMEALAAYPAGGPDAFVVGGEESGQTWICRLTGPCVPSATVPKPREFGLVAAVALPQGRMAYLLRAWDAAQGNRITLTVRDATREIARMDMARPMTIDNLEGLDAVTDSDGSIRFYLISDDNFQSSQRTLLMAFDWRPQP